MRRYLETHPWITFSAAGVNNLPPPTWMLLGEARALCEHMAGVPLPPVVAQDLYEVLLVKGAQASTAIEGNTLTEEQVRGVLRGTYSAPPSRAYQEREVHNVIEALQTITAGVRSGERPTITAELICEYNRLVLDGTDHEAEAVPGELRRHSVVVGGYRAAPAEDCAYLLGRLAEWLESDTFRSQEIEVRFALHVVAALCAHVYIAWIHPFGDGNGRTARLLEFAILARSAMFPLPAANLLANHYNLTGDRYYRELRVADTGGAIDGFVIYAVRGLVDGLREQSLRVRQEQTRVTWCNYVNEVLGDSPSSPTQQRRRAVVLAMDGGRSYTRQELTSLTPEVAGRYAKVGSKTLSRDINHLKQAGLIVQTPDGLQANMGTLAAFLLPTARY